MSFGAAYDFELSFFNQFKFLWVQVPRPASGFRSILHSFSSEIRGSNILVFSSHTVSDCLYSVNLRNCSFCIDCFLVRNSTHCYECVNADECHNVFWSEHCTECRDSFFLSNCSDCAHCLFCTNLSGKRFCIFNEQYSEADYAKKLSEWDFGNRSSVEEAKNLFEGFVKQHPVPHIYSDKPQKNTGNILYGCHNAIDSFFCFDCDNIVHCQDLVNAEQCADGFSFGEKISHALQFVGVGAAASNILNCVECWNTLDNVSYSLYCENSKHLFGCIGLRGASYCILNQQYSKSDYFALLKRIKKHMTQTGEWGEFFPPALSEYPYNKSNAQDVFPITKVQAQVMGYRWDELQEEVKPSELLLGERKASDIFFDVPMHCRELSVSEAQRQVYLCELSGFPFQFSPKEIEFYVAHSLAPPARCFEQRHQERLMKLPVPVLKDRLCSKTSKKITSAYPEHWPRPVYSSKAWEALL